MSDTHNIAGSSPADRREHKRIPVRLSVLFAQGEKQFRLVSENLSLGGIFLKGADTICTDGQSLNLQISVPAAEGLATHTVVGTVVQLIPHLGAGVRFEWSDTTAATRAHLEKLLAQLGMENSSLLHSEEIGLSTDAEEDRG